MDRCVYCGELAEGLYTIHRDGFVVGPDVPLCDTCANDEELSAGEIWERIAQPSSDPCAFNPID